MIDVLVFGCMVFGVWYIFKSLAESDGFTHLAEPPAEEATTVALIDELQRKRDEALKAAELRGKRAAREQKQANKLRDKACAPK